MINTCKSGRQKVKDIHTLNRAETSLKFFQVPNFFWGGDVYLGQGAPFQIGNLHFSIKIHVKSINRIQMYSPWESFCFFK